MAPQLCSCSPFYYIKTDILFLYFLRHVVAFITVKECTYFTLVSHYTLDRLSNRRRPEIPYVQILIIPTRTEKIFMPQMPRHVFYNPIMNLLNITKKILKSIQV
ncbi:hypothetical protein HanRHA438_Chr11g0499201 [Helianthus annuus]|nr:hypothetical protein HanIR_Chr11g0523731 [Helianthus annuus]KAJ0870333.1 hypothetical protein HanRHA438_Chr11g0499201 [Helianthus annuus]